MIVNEKQEALEEFVASEILTCQSLLVEVALKNKLFSIDDLENMYRPFDGRLLAPNVCVQCQCEFSCLDSETGKCESCFEDSQEPQEILEWWLVSSWFGKRLLMEGEPVLENSYGVWWGRCTSGQAISIDYVIQKVYDDMMH